MLLVVFGCALLYWAYQDQAGSLARFNQIAMVVIGVGVILFVGFRPVSGVFVDMPGYAWSYEHVQKGEASSSNDPLFNGLMRLCGPFLSTTGWFVVCAFIYVAPLALAAWRVHGVWAFPVFLAFLTAFSFWGYGTNGIRNGMAMSVLILAFAFHDKPGLMFPLIATALGLHVSALLPAFAFFVVRYIKRTEFWLAFWGLCVAATLVAGNVGEMLLSHYNPFAFDDRVGNYILGPEGSGFRVDFVAYSIIPVLVTLLLAAPVRARSRRSGTEMVSSPALKWTWKRSAKIIKGMGRGRQASLQGASPEGGLASVGFAHVGPAPRSVLEREWKAPRARAVSARQDKTMQGGWGRLPWVQFLASDPFYARLVNTYLLANGIWVLLIHSIQSNRFSYLSWFMMPWILLYPFVPGRSNSRPRTGLITATLCAQYLFTYVMGVVIYPLRGI